MVVIMIISNILISMNRRKTEHDCNVCVCKNSYISVQFSWRQPSKSHPRTPSQSPSFHGRQTQLKLPHMAMVSQLNIWNAADGRPPQADIIYKAFHLSCCTTFPERLFLAQVTRTQVTYSWETNLVINLTTTLKLVDLTAHLTAGSAQQKWLHKTMWGRPALSQPPNKSYIVLKWYPSTILTYGAITLQTQQKYWQLSNVAAHNYSTWQCCYKSNIKKLLFLNNHKDSILMKTGR